LMDFDAYPEWNPFIKKIQGDPRPGTTIEVLIQPEGQQAMTVRLKVLKHIPAQEFRWLGHLFVKGLFDGEHYFQLEAISPNQTKLVHGEYFKGILVGIIMKMIGTATQKGFESMNQALKAEVEKKTMAH